MPTKRVLIVGTLLALVTVALVGAVVTLMRNRVPDSIRLSTGETVRFLGMGMGTAPFSTDKPWFKFARQVLPSRWQSRIPGAITGSCGSDSNSLTAYFEILTPNGLPLSNIPWNAYATEADDGFRGSPGGGYCSFGGPGGIRYYALTLRSAPRRQSDFWLYFLNASGTSMGRLRLPNPISGPFPVWRPEHLPITRTNGPVSLTLKGLVRKMGTGYDYYAADWEVNASSTNWARAKPQYHEFSDATGNFGPSLSLNETAWKLHAIAHRRQDTDFMPSEILTVTNVAVPGSGAFQAIDLKSELNGVSIAVKVLVGGGQFMITNGTARGMTAIASSGRGHSESTSSTERIETWSHNVPFFLIEFNGIKQNDELRVRVRDEQGVKVDIGSSTHRYESNRAGQRSYLIELNSVPVPKVVSLALMISRPLEFDFMVDPKEVKMAPVKDAVTDNKKGR